MVLALVLAGKWMLPVIHAGFDQCLDLIGADGSKQDQWAAGELCRRRRWHSKAGSHPLFICPGP